MSATHHIQRLAFQLDFPSRESYHRISGWLQEAAPDRLGEKLAEVFDQLIPERQTWTIERLEIDVGLIPEEAMKKVLFERIEEELILQLKRWRVSEAERGIVEQQKNGTHEANPQIDVPADSPGGWQVESSAEDQYRSLLFFLGNGYLPFGRTAFWEDWKDQDWEEFAITLSVAQKEEVKKVMEQPSAAFRIFGQLPENSNSFFSVVLDRSFSEWIDEKLGPKNVVLYSNRHRLKKAEKGMETKGPRVEQEEENPDPKVHEKEGSGHSKNIHLDSPFEEVRRELWENLEREPNPPPSEWPSPGQPTGSDLTHSIRKTWEGETSEGGIRRNEPEETEKKEEMTKEIEKKYSDRDQFEEGSHLIAEPPAEGGGDEPQQEMPKGEQDQEKVQDTPESKSKPVWNWGEQERRLTSAGMPIYVENAGLVIVAPFLSRLFDMLELLNPNKTFKDEHSAFMAAAVLDLICYGKADSKEHQMVLNKILCGIPLKTSLPPRPSLPEQTAEVVHSMLQAIIGHWKALKQTSPDGLRNSFLQREGRLQIKGQDWHLVVEQKAYDLLLDELPWSIKYIKLPWMDRLLLVDWR